MKKMATNAFLFYNIANQNIINYRRFCFILIPSLMFYYPKFIVFFGHHCTLS